MCKNRSMKIDTAAPARAIERASLRAWPALRETTHGGWLLRFGDGYTKRANSATYTGPPSGEIEGEIVACEALYEKEGLPAVFRIPSFAGSERVDGYLEARGYRRIDETVVLRRSTEEATYFERRDIEVIPLERWHGYHGDFLRLSDKKRTSHKALLERIPSQSIFAALHSEGEVVSIGLGVAEESLFGIFDVVTAAECRNRGFARRLMNYLLSRARESGARHAYLQVVAENTAARHLYSSLGFLEVYRYWYRVRDESAHRSPDASCDIPNEPIERA